ncbi:hypothetical protein R6Q57_005072 [Mikania cordata]
MNPRPNNPIPNSTRSHTILNRLEIFMLNYNKTRTSNTSNHLQTFNPVFLPSPNLGNSQKRENFWKKVTVSWHRVMGFDAEYRTYHQLNSKWKDMCTKLTKFSGIYSNYANNRKSGMSEENVLKWAEKEYKLKINGQTFNHYHVWVAIKDSPKFRVLCQDDYEVQGSSKRTKNSESNEYSPGGSTAHTNYAVNLEDDE